MEEKYARDSIRSFFPWKLHFWEVFNDNWGFDIVIWNPPYAQVVKWLFSKEKFIYSEWKDKWKQNLYKLFTELSYILCKNNWVSTMIVQSSLLWDISAEFTRELLLQKSSIKTIIEFPATTKWWKVFDNVSQATCIFLYIKEKTNKNIINISVWNNKNTMWKLLFENIYQNTLLEIYPEWKFFPLIKKWDMNIMKKVTLISNKFEKIIKSINQWDINLTKAKKYFSKSWKVKLYRWKNIHKYSLNKEVTEYLDIGILKEKILENRNKFFLVSQEVSNKPIFTLSELSNDSLFWHSVNKIELINPDSNNYILSLLNSNLINWFYSKTSTNNHVMWYELKQLPIKQISQEEQKPFVDLVDQILEITKNEDYLEREDLQKQVKVLEKKIDELVYELYGLTKEEIELVEESLR